MPKEQEHGLEPPRHLGWRTWLHLIVLAVGIITLGVLTWPR